MAKFNRKTAGCLEVQKWHRGTTVVVFVAANGQVDTRSRRNPSNC